MRTSRVITRIVDTGCGLALSCLVLCTAFVAPVSAAPARSVAVLEFRAGVEAGSELASAMAREVRALTSLRVLSPADAQRILGPNVDANVARCKGGPLCIARIGERLECDEVILVGMSQLGDLIIAVQRIDVARHRVISRLADSRQASAEIDQDTIRHYLRKLFPPQDFVRYGQIIVSSDQAGDVVAVDGKSKGKTPLPPLKVTAPGKYDVRVTRAGHTPFLTRLDVLPEATVEVKPTMVPLVRDQRWYQRWWVWAIVGGVAVATATTVTVVSVSRNPGTVPATVRISP